MRRSLQLAVAGVAAGALTVTAAAPAGAQEPLGVEIDITEGAPGEVVTGQVNTADVAEHCITDVEEFQDVFLERTEGIVNIFFGDDVIDEISNAEGVALTLLALIALGVSFDDATAAQVLDQTFVFTFADIATQEPVGEVGNFDPATGEGSVTVPDIEPGLWAVAAACVSLSTDPDTVLEGLSAGADFLMEEFGVPETFEPTPPLDFIAEFFGLSLEDLEELQEFLTPIGPTLLQPLVTPDALGAQLFNVLPDPRDLIADVIADIEGLVADGELKAGQARGLRRPLDNAIHSLNGDRTGPACSQLADFVAEANQKVADGALSPGAADDLIAQVGAIQAQLGCT